MIRAGFIATLGGILACSIYEPASASQLTFRIADSLPAGHFFTREATQYWMDEVVRMTDTAVTFEHYPAGQLGKAGDLFSLTASGAIDIGYVVPSYTADKLPLSAVAELPGTFSTSCEGTMAYWQLAQGEGLLARNEYQPAGVKVLFSVVMPPYQAFLRGPLKALSDMEGKKLRTSSAGQDGIARRLDAIPVPIAAPEAYNALSRGTIDGLIFPASSILAYDIGGLVQSATSGANFGSAVLTFMMAQDRWDGLPGEVRVAMSEAGEATTRRVCTYADRAVDEDSKKIAELGVEFVTFQGESKARLTDEMLITRRDWAGQLDAMNLPGSQILDAFEEAIAALSPR